MQRGAPLGRRVVASPSGYAAGGSSSQALVGTARVHAASMGAGSEPSRPHRPDAETSATWSSSSSGESILGTARRGTLDDDSVGWFLVIMVVGGEPKRRVRLRVVVAAGPPCPSRVCGGPHGTHKAVRYSTRYSLSAGLDWPGAGVGDTKRSNVLHTGPLNQVPPSLHSLQGRSCG